MTLNKPQKRYLIGWLIGSVFNLILLALFLFVAGHFIIKFW